MNIILNVLHSNKLFKIPILALEASIYLGNIKKGLICISTKHNSLLGRQFIKDEKKEFKEKEKSNLLVERDRIVTCYTQEISFEDRKKIFSEKRKLYRVLSLFKKTYNKWFMIHEKQQWSDDMKPDDLKKYCCAVRIITKGIVDDYEDIDLIQPNYELKSI